MLAARASLASASLAASSISLPWTLDVIIPRLYVLAFGIISPRRLRALPREPVVFVPRVGFVRGRRSIGGVLRGDGSNRRRVRHHRHPRLRGRVRGVRLLHLLVGRDEVSLRAGRRQRRGDGGGELGKRRDQIHANAAPKRRRRVRIRIRIRRRGRERRSRTPERWSRATPERSRVRDPSTSVQSPCVPSPNPSRPRASPSLSSRVSRDDAPRLFFAAPTPPRERERDSSSRSPSRPRRVSRVGSGLLVTWRLLFARGRARGRERARRGEGGASGTPRDAGGVRDGLATRVALARGEAAAGEMDAEMDASERSPRVLSRRTDSSSASISASGELGPGLGTGAASFDLGSSGASDAQANDASAMSSSAMSSSAMSSSGMSSSAMSSSTLSSSLSLTTRTTRVVVASVARCDSATASRTSSRVPSRAVSSPAGSEGVMVGRRASSGVGVALAARARASRAAPRAGVDNDKRPCANVRVPIFGCTAIYES